jgi:hypothetical protein
MNPQRITSKPAPTTRTATTGRIVGAPIAPLVPAFGNVFALIVGEAPGPRGADKSGIPFFGDGAGKHLYRALRNIGAIDLPIDVDSVKWDGATLRSAGLAPVAHHVSLTNAFDRCPTDDGMRFRAPTRLELESDENVNRLALEISTLQLRALGGVVTLGKVAERTMYAVLKRAGLEHIPIYPLPHPAAQGLLSMAENRGRGARMSDLQQQWMTMCAEAIYRTGFAQRMTNPENA